MAKQTPYANLLVEIGTEELPPKALGTLGQTFAESLLNALRDIELAPAQGKWHWFATPRRLAVWIGEVAKRQPDRTTERRGPALTAAVDKEGNPTKAAQGFARSCGVEFDKLQRVKTEKGEWLVHRRKQRGKPAAELIPACIEQALKQLPIPKRMRWSDLDAEFVRPVHWLVLLHGSELINAELLSVRSDRFTRGHRFHAEKPIRLSHADRYAMVLAEKGFVVADYATRREQIRDQAQKAAKRLKGKAQISDALLDEVTGLVEWPHAIVGNFDKDFLSVPDEALISSMQDHQKYFPVLNNHRKLLPHFITISNIKSKKPARVQQGNERVLRARLADARFFWDSDRKRTLESRCGKLVDVLFHKKLGSVADKVDRIERIAGSVAELAGYQTELCRRGARLCKADLVTDMVGEFPDLQGTMGRYYAQHDGEPALVAQAIAEHYQPRFAGDELPASEVGKVVALADKLDSLVGIFAAGEPPSGDKDPYGLRRAALGVLRILIEGELALDLMELIEIAVAAYSGGPLKIDDETAAQVFAFCAERLTAYYAAKDFSAEEITAVAVRNPTSPLDFDRRVRAVSAFRKLPAASSLAAANKRIGNILRRADQVIPDRVDPGYLTDAAEQDLNKVFIKIKDEVQAKFGTQAYQDGLVQLAQLRQAIDRFFDDVMVMTEDPQLRANRLALLQQIHELFLQVADVSQLQVTADD